MRRFLRTSVAGVFWICCAFSQSSAQNADTESLLHSVRVKNHQLLFDGIGHQNLAKAASEHAGQVRIVSGRGLPFFPDGRSPSVTEELQKMICETDLVAIVSIKKAESHLSHDQAWVFTDNLASVSQVLKGDNGLQQGADIVIARSGGKVATADGSTVEVDDSAFPPLRIGNSYLLFLTFSKDSGQYLSRDQRGEFRLLGPSLQPLVPDSKQADIAKAFDLGSIWSAVSNQAGACAKGRLQ